MSVALFTVNVTSLRGMQVGLLFKAQDRAQRVHRALHSALFPNTVLEDRGLENPATDELELTDDFGTTLSVTISDVMWVTLVDVVQQLKGQEEMQIVGARANKELNTRAMSDLSIMGGIQPGGIINPNGRRN